MENTQTKKDKMAAGLLAILLGGLGIHMFYLGKTSWGILFLCFSWSGIPSIIGIIQGIMYLTKSEEDFQNLYVKGDQLI